jgi:hypothetical protein
MNDAILLPNICAYRANVPIGTRVTSTASAAPIRALGSPCLSGVDRSVAAWRPRWRAISRTILVAPRPRAVSRIFPAKAMREEYIVDPQGRTVRAKHAARIRQGNRQMTLWADIRTASQNHMAIAFQQRRQQILGECHQLKSDVDSYNENANRRRWTDRIGPHPDSGRLIISLVRHTRRHFKKVIASQRRSLSRRLCAGCGDLHQSLPSSASERVAALSARQPARRGVRACVRGAVLQEARPAAPSRRASVQ